MRHISRFVLIMAVLMTTAGVFAQDKKSLAEVIQSKNFVFRPQTVSPLGGSTRQLNYDYDLTLKGDTLISYLPYFGRAYVAPIGGTEGPMDFRSTDFSYEATPRKKGGWEVLMMPNDTRDVRQMRLTVTEGGYATLQVTSNTRQSISYSGIVKPKN